MRAVAWVISSVRVPCRFRVFVTRTLDEETNDNILL